jgi:mRNA interferase RelE/StbE
VKYAFRWRERAVRQLRAIPQPAALTILRALAPLGDDPRRSDANVRKLAGYDDRYRLRVGDYRVIYEVMDRQLVILVVGVGHRRRHARTRAHLPLRPEWRSGAANQWHQRREGGLIGRVTDTFAFPIAGSGACLAGPRRARARGPAGAERSAGVYADPRKSAQ